jgi:hypothetical protein
MIYLIAPMVLIVILSVAKHLDESLRSHQYTHCDTKGCFTLFNMTLSRDIPRRLYLLYLTLSFMLASCGGSLTPTLPTAYIVRAGAAATLTPRTPTPAPPATPPDTIPTALPSASPALDPSLDPPLDQYRAWMQEARTAHPYSEPIELMWQVMMCESSGQAEQVAEIYYGLFQYQQVTWAGDWNPYRAEPILDPRAQIFATAKAWQDGNQHWWGCYE